MMSSVMYDYDVDEEELRTDLESHANMVVVGNYATIFLILPIRWM